MTDNKKTYDRWDLALFVYGLAGLLFSLTAALSMTVLGLFSLISQDMTNAQSAQWTAAGLLALGLVAIPAIVESGRVIFGGQPTKPQRPERSWYWIAALFPFGLTLGYLGYEQAVVPGLLGPIGQLIAVSTPVALIVLLLRRAGPLLKPRRLWGHFLAGLWAIPFITIIVEAVVLIFGVILAAFGLVLTPGGQQLIDRLSPYLNTPGVEPTEIPEELLLDIVLNPIVIIGLIVMLGVMVPIIEEIFKSASVWPFLPRRVDPATAFLGGALGGLGFAFAEAMFLTQPAAGWLVTAVARSGASSMHALASGLAAWGLAQGFVRKRWGKFLLAFSVSIGLHALWNVAAVGVSLGAAANQQAAQSDPLLTAIVGSGVGVIVALSLTSIYLLPTLQSRFHQQEEDPKPSEEEA